MTCSSTPGTYRGAHNSSPGVIFDLDETLIDRKGSLDVYARRLFRDLPASSDCDDLVREFHRLDGNGRVPRAEFFEALSRGPLRGVSTARIEAHFRAHAWTEPLLLAGVLPLLRRLKHDGWRLGIVTNGGVPSQSAKIANTGLSELVDAFVISEAFGAKKPAPEIFAHMADAIAIEPARSWFVGDDPRSDIWGARQSGFRTCWIERHLEWPADLAPCYDARIRSISEVSEVVTRVV